MGYRVIYGDDPFEQPKRSRKGMVVLVLALALGVRFLWPQGVETVAEITAAILEGESLTTFCRSVVEEALAEGD